jgi:polyhydroxybutyrate depolymerase
MTRTQAMNPLRRALSVSVLCGTTVAILFGPWGAAAASGTTTQKTLTSGGEARLYRVFKPPGLRGRSPLIVALHGAGGSGAKFERRSGWDGLAQRAHVLVAYPSAFKRGWRNNGQLDVRFLSSMLDAIERDYKVDRRRVYFTGFSSGAFMTYRIACDLAQRVPAIGPVAGAPVQDCAPPPTRPVAVIHIHGTADARIPYLGGRAIANGQPFGQAFPSAFAMARRWVRWDHCSANAPSARRGTVTTKVWRRCRAGTEVRLVTLAGWTHAFPTRADGAPIDGPSTIWGFLKRFSLPGH